ncbi:MAG: hypothetical protein K0S80_3768 [Neobacillus sp.]|jgi:hypothetical protein|nr:hypothetical protein [Neobacillus sp.]
MYGQIVCMSLIILLIPIFLNRLNIVLKFSMDLQSMYSQALSAPSNSNQLHIGQHLDVPRVIA